ncbi:MAG: helix-turn-helix transcriptional regulator [Thermoguttaceae bacterium]|jgi:predicted DNA-binding transcriptional regulator AlpA
MNSDSHSSNLRPLNAEGPQDEPALITAPELARMMRISVRTLWRLRSSGQLVEPIKVGGNTRWRLDEVRRWIGEGCPARVQRDN